jgi:hypothetical protein
LSPPARHPLHALTEHEAGRLGRRKDIWGGEESDGVPAHLEFQMVDLNGDGRPEVIVQLLHPFHCGSRGCAMFVFDLTAHWPRSLADILASEVKPARTATNG